MRTYGNSSIKTPFGTWKAGARFPGLPGKSGEKHLEKHKG